MNDGPEWFAPKRYGYGVGLPIAWQGWVLLLAYLGLVVGLARLLHGRPIPLIAAAIPPTIIFIMITHRTTRGGWRWRWGERN